MKFIYNQIKHFFGAFLLKKKGISFCLCFLVIF